MKKSLFVVTIVLVVLASLAVVGFAYAQSLTPPTPTSPYGDGFMGGRGWHGGMMGGYNGQVTGTYGPMHEYMFNAMAEAFGLTPEELQALHDEGKTMWDVAQESGLTFEDFSKLMIEARTKALEQAVADGIVTQEQADWMIDHMNGMWGGSGGGFGPCHGGTGNFGQGRGSGRRWNSQPDLPSS